MAGIKISALPNAPTVGPTDLLPLVQAGITKNCTANQLLTFVENNIVIDNADNWVTVTANFQNLMPFTSYITNSTDTLVVDYLLPAAITSGTTIEVTGISAGGFTISQNAGQSINFNAVSTTVGVTGGLASTTPANAVRLVCVVDNLTFNVLSYSGTFTIA